MEDRRRRPRVLTRRFECTRLEDQLWIMAFEEVCPVVRRSTGRRAPRKPQPKIESVAVRA